MELVDRELEIRALRTLCSRRDEPECAKLLMRLDSSHFRDPISQLIWRRIRARIKRSGRPPPWSFVRTDPVLTEEARQSARMYSDIKALPKKASPEDYDELHSQLDFHAKGRIMWGAAGDVLKELEGDSPDMPSVMDGLSSALERARRGAEFSQPMRLSGDDGDTSSDEFAALLADGDSPVIPTGFKTFDDRNGGLLRGSLVVLAAQSGGGKTSASIQVALNLVRANDCYSVCLVPLEMDRMQMLARIYANVSGVPKGRILSKSMTSGEKDDLRKARDDLARELKARESSIEIDEQAGASMEDVLSLRAPHRDDLIIVDQLTLLSDSSASNDRQWAAMGEACRVAKLHAVRNGNVVVVLTQLDDHGLVKYSRAVVEHADLVLAWGRDERPVEGRARAEVRTRKARHQEPVDFVLDIDIATSRMVDAGPASRDDGDAPKRARVGERAASRDGDDDDLDRYLGDKSV